MALYSEAFRREVVRLLRAGGRCRCSRVNWGARRSRLRNWSRQLDADEGKAEGLASDKRGERRSLRRENRC
jgi:transposase-like protein